MNEALQSPAQHQSPVIDRLALALMGQAQQWDTSKCTIPVVSKSFCFAERTELADYPWLDV